MKYGFDVLRTARALYLLAEFSDLGPAEAREVARFLNEFADNRPRPSTGNVWLDMARDDEGDDE